MNYTICDETSATEFLEYIEEEGVSLEKREGNKLYLSDKNTYKVYSDYQWVLDKFSKQYNPLIFGKDSTEGIISIELSGNDIVTFKTVDGELVKETKAGTFWICANRKLNKNFKRMKGDLHYNWIQRFRDYGEYRKFRSIYQKQNKDIFVVYNEKEAEMIYNGTTLFKGMKPSDLSALSFDIEGAGLVRNEDSDIYVISATFRGRDGEIVKEQFRKDHYGCTGEMIVEFCDWVRDVDPDIILGHNIYGYDLDYMRHVAEMEGVDINLGRDGSAISFARNPTPYRVDGSQTWDFKKVYCFGRHFVDTMFLAVKYDIGRNFPSWGLKPIVEHLGLVKEGRQFYDASKIRENWNDPVEREKIVEYCTDDGDDALDLFDLMIPAYFYMTQSIPKPFQLIVNSASGAWLNSIFVRGYIQDKHGVPKATEVERFEGAHSYGVPGIYKNCFKQDVASLYPSIMRQWGVCDEEKDPKRYFSEVVEYFTIERLKNKKLAAETKEKYYKDLEQSQKIFINSLYGFMGAKGLNFNSPENAAFVTRKGREILERAVMWATGKDLDYWRNLENS